MQENKQESINKINSEVKKVIVGKDEVVNLVLMALLADGHILLDDVPGVGKTTLAVALSRAIGLKYTRIQFTPDVLPSDIVGFSLYQKTTGKFEYIKGAVTRTNLLLADEINRTSAKTQSALLEAMEERQVTVDGNVHKLETPFIVIATQNQVGTAGTQLLPQAQLDRFLVKLTIGYPDYDSEVDILRDRKTENPADNVVQVTTSEEIEKMQQMAMNVTIKDEILKYITDLVRATRENEMIELGASPRGALAVSRMARACAFVKGRDFVIPEDVAAIFINVCAHRIILSQKAKVNKMTTENVLKSIIGEVKAPYIK